ncbi:MAG: cytidine deaminase [Saprospiraceae bacterium]|nr:cytidine deaminase [Saprospiraceae bacterium]
MKEAKKTVTYSIWEDIESLPELDRKLVLAANRATESAYAPYSNFFVGAALLLDDHSILKGSNQENAAYSVCLCAERNVLTTHGASDSDQGINAIAVVARHKTKELSEPVFPCGVCRQMMCEFEDRQKAPIRVLVHVPDGPCLIFSSARALLPFAFSGSVLR